MGYGRTRKLAGNVVVPALAGATLATTAPILGAVASTASLPGTAIEAYNSLTDSTHTTGEKIRHSIPLAASVAGTVGFGSSAVKSMRTPKNSYTNPTRIVENPKSGRSVVNRKNLEITPKTMSNQPFVRGNTAKPSTQNKIQQAYNNAINSVKNKYNQGTAKNQLNKELKQELENFKPKPS